MKKLSKPPKRIIVKITGIARNVAWYQKGEQYTVLNEIVFSYIGGPAFQVLPHGKGISIRDCEIIGPAPEEYTKKQLRKIVGHDFVIKE